jgi:succinate dehydrogenase / fumarate reductase iron-sulfur subunit
VPERLGLLPQGQPEQHERVMKMVAQMDLEGFGNCSNHGSCENACLVDISVDFIARLNRDLLKANFVGVK